VHLRESSSFSHPHRLGRLALGVRS
jgi:hypothetical protein